LKAIVISHFRVAGQSSLSSTCFAYELYGESGLMHADTVTLRTAQIFAAELAGATPFMAMMSAIAAAQTGQYDALVGRIFED